MPNDEYDPACETCARVHSGPEFDVVPDRIRSLRLLLAVIRGAGDATAVVAHEVGDCRYCQGRLLAGFLAMSAGFLVHVNGSQENAITFVEQSLIGDLDGP